MLCFVFLIKVPRLGEVVDSYCLAFSSWRRKYKRCIVLYLLNANASLSVRNKKNYLPEHYAKKSGNNILICLLECLRYRKDTETEHRDKKAEAARALESVLLGRASYEAIEPYMNLFSSKVSPSLARFYKAFLPIIAPYTEANDEPQVMAIASSSNFKL